MEVGLIIVGDELLSGKRQDRHLAQVIGLLDARGLALSWCWMLGDEPAQLERQFRHSLALSHPVLVTGGIGATPDDCTRQAAARAAGVALQIHPEAAAIITERWGEQAYPNRIHMAELPQDARLIPNPVNRIAGFSLADHHFVPGFPDMAWPMMAWALDTYYSDRFPRQRRAEHLIRVYDVPESELIPVMQALLDEYPVKVSSLPSSGRIGEVELGISGDPAAVLAAIDSLCRRLTAAGLRWQDQGLRQP